MDSITRTVPQVGFPAATAPLSVRVKIALAFAAIYVIWGSTFLATRYAVVTIPPFFVSGTRFFLAGVALFGFARIRNREPLTARTWLSAAAMGTLFFVICHGGVSWAAKHVPSGVLALLMSSISMWTAILEIAGRSRTRPGRRVMVSLLVGFAGIALLVVRPEVLAGSHSGSLGAVVVLVGAFSWAAGTVLTKKVPLPSSVILSAAMQMLCGGGLLIVLGIVTGQGAGWSPASISPQSAIAMVFLTLIGSLVGFTCYIWLLGHCPPTQVATYAYVNPIIALFLGSMIAGEQLSFRSLAASVIVVGAVAAIVSAKRPSGDRGGFRSVERLRGE
jgi:drug/metabolite transporter (DMT)-like permease